MKYTLSAISVLMMGTAPVLAGGVERSGQFLGPLFEPGNYAEMSYAHVNTSLEGNDLAAYGGSATGNVTGAYNMASFAYKHQFNANLSGLVMLDQPFGADIGYPVGGSVMLGGTEANVDNLQLTGVVRFVMPETGFGAHAGIRAARTKGDVTLSGLAYGPVNGYVLDTGKDTAYGWLAGVSWEKPEIAARVALTYNSGIDHEFDVTETGPNVDPDGPGPAPVLPLLNGSSKMDLTIPESWNLEFQTGVNPQTLMFGSIRWVNWSEFRVDPDNFVRVTGDGLVSIDDTTTYTLGVARKINDQWSGALSFTYEPKGDNDALLSPLGPANGKKGITLAAIYTMDKLKVTTGISYVKIGDAFAETGTPDVARAAMRDNDAWGIGVKVGYSF